MTASRLAACLLGVMLVGVPMRGDDSAAEEDNPLYEIATGAQEKDGRLHVYPYEFSKTWLNGVRQGDDDDDLSLKPGDVVDSFVCGDFTEVREYRLVSLSPKRAVFTLRYFAVVRTPIDKKTERVQKGRQISWKSFAVDLTKPNGLLVDYGFNYVELGDGSPSRSKSLR